jgi:hypothetical protein
MAVVCVRGLDLEVLRQPVRGVETGVETACEVLIQVSQHLLKTGVNTAQQFLKTGVNTSVSTASQR